MGSTYSVNKQAAAMVAPNGTIFFALFEQTYESNVFPQHPHWCAIYFGTAEACMDRVITHATSCEGGMLKEKGGDTTPSAYIKHWREALANPLTLRRGTVSAEFGKGIYKLDEDKQAAISTILAAHGHAGILDAKVAIDIGEKPELLQAVIDAGTSVWKFIDHTDVIHESATDWAAYSPALCSGVVPEFDVFYITEKPNRDREHWVLKDGQMMGLGWSYSTIGRLIDRIGKASERTQPGSVEAVIKTIRAKVKQAVPFPMEQRIRIDREKAEDCYRASAFDALAVKLGKENTAELETTVRDILAAEALYDFRSMTDGMVAFLDHPVAKSLPQQQDLLAA
jgi:hypothetical protein